jgi:hypothetical protein
MSVSRHVDESVAQLRMASARINAARQRALSLKSLREWLEALTDFTSALSDIQSFNNQSVHEKLHDLATRGRVKTFPTERARSRND